MTTLSAARTRAITHNHTNAFPILTTSRIWAGAAVGLVRATGKARALQAGDTFVGFAQSSVNHIHGEQRDTVVTVLDCGQTLLAITGALETDVGKDVYATDDDTFTLSSSGGSFVGVAKLFVSAGKLLVEVSPPSDLNAVRLASSGTALVSGAGNTWRIGLRPSGDTTGATDVANMIAAIALMPSTGGQLELEAGVFYLNAEVPLAKTVDVVGAGGGIAGDAGTAVSVGPTTINCLSATANGFNVTANGCTLRNFSLVNTSVSTPTAGAGILASSFNGGLIDRVTVAGFYNNLDIGGVYYHITNNNIYDQVNYGLYMHHPGAAYLDHGDMIVANNVFSGWKKTYASAANLRYESGGGLKITGNKFNSGGQPGNVSAGVAAYCIDLMVADGCTTSSLVITGNSISGWATNTANIRIGQLGTTGKYINTVLVGNEITVGVRGLIYGGASAAADYISNLECSGNIFSYFSAAGITLFNCREVDLGRNEWRLCTSPFIHLGASPDTGSGTMGVRVAPQSIGQHDGVDIIQDDRKFSNGIYVTGSGVEYDYTRGMYITTNAVWQTACVLTIPNGSGGIIELDVDGQNGNAAHNSPNNKGIAIRQSRAYDVNTSGVVSLTTVGTDVAVGTGAAFTAVQFVTGANTVTIQVQTTDGTQLSLWAGARVQVAGKLTKFHIGA